MGNDYETIRIICEIEYQLCQNIIKHVQKAVTIGGRQGVVICQILVFMYKNYNFT